MSPWNYGLATHTQHSAMRMSTEKIPEGPGTMDIVVMGQCASKSNSRRLVRRGKRIASIKSVGAMKFSDLWMQQIPPGSIECPMEGDLSMECDIYYSSRRPDLDDTLVCDLLQASGCILNDRQIKRKDLLWGLDKKNPRVEIRLRSLTDDPRQPLALWEEETP